MKSSNRSLVIGIMGMALAMGGGSAPAESRPKAKALVRPTFQNKTYIRLHPGETPSSKYRKNANQRRDRRKKLAMANSLVGSR